MTTSTKSTKSNKDVTEQVTETIKEAVKAPAKAAPANPAFINFPVDTWGFTSKMRKETVAAAMRVKGSEDKMKVFRETMQLIAEFAEARFNEDAAAREAQKEALLKEAELSKLAMLKAKKLALKEATRAAKDAEAALKEAEAAVKLEEKSE